MGHALPLPCTRKAIDYYEQQLTITRKIGDRGGESRALWNSAQVRGVAGEQARAISDAKMSLGIKRAIEDSRAADIEAWLRARGIDPDSPCTPDPAPNLPRT